MKYLLIIYSLILLQIYFYEPRISYEIPTHYTKAIFTAYTLSPEETDESPCLGAIGNLCDVVGTRCLLATGDRSIPLHTKILVKELGECEVVDRMNKKYDNKPYFDLLMNSKEEALTFGVKRFNYLIK